MPRRGKKRSVFCCGRVKEVERPSMGSLIDDGFGAPVHFNLKSLPPMSGFEAIVDGEIC
jgi:hypothetical protein